MPFSNELFSLLAWLSTAACGAIAYVLMRRFDVKLGWRRARALLRHVPAAVRRLAAPGSHNVDPEIARHARRRSGDRRPPPARARHHRRGRRHDPRVGAVPDPVRLRLLGGAPIDCTRLAHQRRRPPRPGDLRGGVRTGIPTTPNRYGSVRSIVDEVFDDPRSRRAASSARSARSGSRRRSPCPRCATRAPAWRCSAAASLGFLFARDWGRVICCRPRSFTWPARTCSTTGAAWRSPLLPPSWRSTGYAVYMQVHGVESNIVNGPLPSYPIR